MPTTIRITARGLTLARNAADILASIDRALDTPPEERDTISAVVGTDGEHRVHVPWTVVQSELQAQRARIIQELHGMGIELLPPDPAEKERIRTLSLSYTHPPKPQR